MNTTFKELIASNLLAVCQETTINMINKINSSKIDENDPKVKRFREAYDLFVFQWSKDAAQIQFKALAKILNEPLLERIADNRDSKSMMYDPFTVVKLLPPTTNSKWAAGLTEGQSYIITNGKNKQLLDELGYTGEKSVNSESSIHQFSTPDEIVKCIQELNDAQWKTIMTNDLFAPIVNSALNTPVKVDENQVNIDAESGE